MPYESSIDKNGRINNDLKQIVKDCFSNIFEMLGKKNFKRWVHTRELSEDVKSLIVDYMSEEEEKERPGAAGFAQSNNTIKIREKKGQIITKGIATHEIYHIMTKYSRPFGIYIDEGMTEYLKGMSTEEGAKTYSENVRMVKFLHQMLGDSIVKAYLLGKDDDFDKSFADKIGLDSTDEIKKFYNILDKRHKLLYPVTEDEINKHNAEKEKIEQELVASKLAVKNMIRKIIIGKARHLAQNLEFYQDGNFGYNGSLGIIEEWIKQIPEDFKFDFQEKYELEHEALGEIFEHSHLLVGLEGKAKEQKKEELISKILFARKDKNGHITQVNTSYRNTEKFNQENQDLASKIFQKSFENCGDISIIDFIDKTLKIISHINPSERQVNALISEYAIKMFGEKADITLIDSLVKENLDRYKSLFDIEKQREADTVESSYRKIDDTSYIEKRDNQYFYVKILEDGTYVEAEMEFTGGSYFDSDSKQNIRIERCSSQERIAHKILEQENKYKETRDIPRKVYRVNDNGKSKIISLTDEIDSLKVHGLPDIYIGLGVLNSKEFKKLEIISPLVKQVQKEIDSGEYIEILDDAENPYKIKGVRYTADIDERSRKINFTKLRQDLFKIEQLLPKDKRGRLLQEQLIEMALDRTFGTKKEKQQNGEFKRDDTSQKTYDEIIRQILSGKIDENKLEDLINTLNQTRRERVEENKKHALISFATPEARKKFDESQRLKKIIDTSNKEFEFSQYISGAMKIPYGVYYKGDGPIEDFSNVAFGLKKGVHIIGAGIQDKSRTFYIDKLCEDLTSKVGNIRSKKMYELVGEYIEKVLDTVYQTGDLKKDDEEIQKHYRIIINSIIQNVMNGTEIDDELTQDSLSYLNENRTKRVIEKSKRSGAAFSIEDPTTKLIYEQLCELSTKLPKGQFDIVREGFVNAANQQKKEGQVKE